MLGWLWSKAAPLGVVILNSLRKDIFFWLSLGVGVGSLFVPQVRTVIWQAVKGPNLLEASSVGGIVELLGSKTTCEAAGFLAYLALLATLFAASILFVVPPSFLAGGGNAALPVQLPNLPTRWLVAVVLGLLVLLPVFVLLPIPPLVLILVTVVLLFRPASRIVDTRAGWLVRAAEVSPPRLRFWAGLVLVLSGVVVVVLGLGARGHTSRLYPLAGSACQLFGSLGLLTGVWLALIPSGVGKPPKAPLGTVRTAQGRLLGWLSAVSAFGEVIWILAYAPVTRDYFSYRLYTIWAFVTLAAVLTVVASLLDTWEVALNEPQPAYGYAIPVRL